MKAAFLALLALALTCDARVGETYEQFLKRAGIKSGRLEFKTENFATVTHFKNGITIEVRILDGIIATETFSPVQEIEAVALLSNYAGNWKRSDGVEGMISWSQGPKADIHAHLIGKRLFVSDRRIKRLIAEENRAAEIAATKKAAGL